MPGQSIRHHRCRVCELRAGARRHRVARGTPSARQVKSRIVFAGASALWPKAAPAMPAHGPAASRHHGGVARRPVCRLYQCAARRRTAIAGAGFWRRCVAHGIKRLSGRRRRHHRALARRRARNRAASARLAGHVRAGVQAVWPSRFMKSRHESAFSFHLL